MAGTDKPLKATCHCGAISITVPREPDHINECQCTICRRYGAAWAYYKSTEVEIKKSDSNTKAYVWGDRTIEFHHCQNCGCVCYWQAIEASPEGGHEFGVNTRNMDPEDIKFVDRKISYSWLIQPVDNEDAAHHEDRAKY